MSWVDIVVLVVGLTIGYAGGYLDSRARGGRS